MLLITSFVAACQELIVRNKDASFKDVSKRPPDAQPETIAALSADREFGEWVIYQDRLCDKHGCVQ